jgi:hypothetical protein
LSSSDLLEPELLLQDSEFDGEHYAHYVMKHGLVESMIYGAEVTALCGWKFVPTRDPEKYPVCPRCKRIHEGLPAGD